MLDISRNQYFLAGLVVLLLGIQFRMVYSFTMTPECTQFVAEQTGHPLAAVNAATATASPTQTPIVKKTVEPPEWIGWALLSIGSVFVLHSMAMRKPD